MAIQEIICDLFKLGASCYSMPIDKLLIEYLLVPSVILIIILYVAVNMFLAGITHKIKGLLAIVFYIVIVYQGWYGIIAQFTMAFLPLWLLGIIALFFGGKIFKKKWVTEGPSKLAKTVSDWKELKKEITEGRKKEDEESLLDLLTQYKGTKSFVNEVEKDPNATEMQKITAIEYRAKLGELEGKIKTLGRKLKLTEEEKRQYKQDYNLDFW